MKITSKSFPRNGPIPKRYAFCTPDPETHSALSSNVSPHLAWSDVPPATRSFAVLCVDPDVPSRPEEVNREGRTIPKSLPRVNFYHWVLVDIPSSRLDLPEGSESDGITVGGKPIGRTNFGMRGVNDYTAWFQGDPQMKGLYGGYDGPCPPWNDEILHHYVFRVYALKVETLGLSGAFTGAQAEAALKGQVLDQVEWVGTYTQNPAVPW
ncbi:MAG: YbhB/YbcL family Raf kinase inhibitor-like protein [Deltaproteobacteria bacterium]|nr:YbhB/YbcL family Raf kinase inhibitor-like protein [Deltaproteobacteria bacterium]